ncbi:MAG: DUF4348 domain-containing protein [Bacteroidaceae bacterium]|nr:DUF4348 domain-containing protein [Bacteroidaceae bacterium]
MGLLASCAGKQTRASEEVVTEPSDTVETLPVEEFPLVEEKEVIPARVDELFDDFIWNFATNERMQRRRIKFPLQVVTPEGIGQVVQDEWQHDSLFANQSTYTLMFDDESDFDYEGDTSLSAAILEWIYLDSSMRQQYFFGKHKGAWMLDSIALAPLAEVDDEGGFVSFYTRFANDSIYQLDHITNPIEFVTLDPDDEFTILETTLGISQWFSFKPELPKEKLTNICYGQTNDDRSRRKILKVNGSQDGSSIILYFRKRGGEWEMYRFEDTSV